MPKTHLTDAEKKKLVKEILGNKYSEEGNNWPVFSKVLDYVGTTSDVFTVAELIPATNSLLTGSGTLSVIGSTASVLSIFLMPVGHMIAITNAWQTGHRDYSYRCIAYTITAWAFQQPIPVKSNQILTNMRTGILVRNKRTVSEYNAVWRKTSFSVIGMLNNIATEKGIEKKKLQFVLQALGSGDPAKLCLLLLHGFENKINSYAHKLSWKSNYKITYPH